MTENNCLFNQFKGEIEQKNLGYSPAQLQEFLLKMEGISPLGENIFTYGQVGLKISDLGLDSRFKIAIHRSCLEIKGPAPARAEFYHKFLINYMTMGG